VAQLAPPVNAQATRKPARAVARGPIQPKLDVGPAGDHFEREADSVAATVMAGGSAPVSIPPTITPLGAQRKAAPPKKEEERKARPATSGGLSAQRKAAPKKKEEEKKPAGARAQRKAAPKREEKKPKGRAQREAASGAAGGTASPSVEAMIQSMRAGPAPGLDGATRGFMENRFGRDFGDVRVHHGTQAAAAADSLGAQAFTTGNDIFFNRGQYNPNSSGGRRLLAHELAHTVQQKGAKGTAARMRIQRAKTAPSATKKPVPDDGVLDFALDPGDKASEGQIKREQKEIVLPFLNLPMINGALKGTASKKMSPMAANGTLPQKGAPYSIKAIGPRGGTRASNIWKAGAERDWSAGLATELKKMAGVPDDATERAPPKKKAYQLTNGKFILGFADPNTDEQRLMFLFGTPEELSKAQLLQIPRWKESGVKATFEADHILEWQLGGADDFLNMWLLDANDNTRIGPMIDGRVNRDIADAVKSVRDSYDFGRKKVPEPSDVRANWRLTFKDLREGPKMKGSNTFWTRDDIGDRKHITLLKFLTSKDLKERKFQPRQRGESAPAKIYVFPTPDGGRMNALNVKPDNSLEVPANAFLFPNMELKGGVFEEDNDKKIATINVLWRKTKRNEKKQAKMADGKVVREEVKKKVDLEALPGFMDVGFISTASVYDARKGWVLPGASPVDFEQFALNEDGYLVGQGVLSATKALLPKLRADVIMDPQELRIDFPIPMESFSLGPVTITTLTMSLGVGDSGPFVRGLAGFEVASLGTGTITADVTKNGPVIAGTFDLSMDFLNPASIEVGYDFAEDTFSAQMTLGVEKGRIPGVDAGQVTIGMSRDAVTVDGALTLGGPLKGTIIAVTYSKDTGLKIGADNIPLPLSSIPAIQNATLSISATRKPEGGWTFAGAGQATLLVPGATGTIGISYLDGALTFTAAAEIAKGPATGSLDFTATNRAIDEEGRPIEGPPVDEITVWGRGSVTIKFGNLLTGTAGVELTPDNRVIISGAIGLPPVFEVFPKKEYNKDLFTLAPPEFPIWGVSVAGVGVGIFAFVDARVFFNASVGPGEIRNAQLGATMDLDKPEDATVTGHAEFHVPAYAGLGLDVGGGLRARAAVAYVEGRVGLTGELGIQADAAAAIDVSWSRAAGLALSADLSAQAQPKFSLSANASVTVGVDLLVTDVSHTFGPWTKELGSFGPDMTLGVRMPVRWSEANGLDLSLDNIEVQRPSLDAKALMSSVFDQLAG